MNVFSPKILFPGIPCKRMALSKEKENIDDWQGTRFTKLHNSQNLLCQCKQNVNRKQDPKNNCSHP